jgi:hypothetical protein
LQKFFGFAGGQPFLKKEPLSFPFLAASFVCGLIAV